MLKFIIRLDDASPYMIKNNWEKIELILDKYNVKPIVGIIPDCKDEEFIKNPELKNFWEKYALNWQNKGWIIAQHGLNHKLNKYVRTEYCGISYQKQKNNIEKGYEIMKRNNITPVCFFAPAHTFDDNTIKACVDLNYFKFISDGISTYPYKYNNMMFLPNIFDTPHKILPFGIYTFVYHPNNMKNEDFDYLDFFIRNNKEKFLFNLEENLLKYNNRKRNMLDKSLSILIYIFRKLKRTKR